MIIRTINSNLYPSDNLFAYIETDWEAFQGGEPKSIRLEKLKVVAYSTTHKYCQVTFGKVGENLVISDVRWFNHLLSKKLRRHFRYDRRWHDTRKKTTQS